MIMSALLYEHHYWIWPVMLFASAGVVEHAGIKIPYFAFFAHDSGIRTREPPRNMLVAMGIGAFLCILIGVQPHLLYNLLPGEVDYHAYSYTHILTQIQLLCFAIAAVAAFHLWKIYPAEIPSVNLDVDWVYRRAAVKVTGFVGSMVGAADGALRTAFLDVVRRTMRGAFRASGPRGVLARTWPAGSMVLWVSILLSAFLLFQLF